MKKKTYWKMRGVNEIFSKREKTLLDRQSGGKKGENHNRK